MSKRLELGLSWAILVLATGASLTGLVVPGIYRDPAVLLPQLYGQDLVTLAVGVPLLAVGMLGVARRWVTGRVVWLGALGYLFYAYATYAFGTRWNPLFLVYTALLGLSAYALGLGLVGTPVEAVAARLRERMPRRTVAWLLMSTAGIFGALWLAEELVALASLNPPRSVVAMEIPTQFIHVMDLALVLPALAAAAWLLLAGRAWGFVLAAVLLTKVFTLGAAVVAMGWFSARAGFPAAPSMMALFVAVTAFAGALLGWSLRGPPVGRASGADRPARA